MYKLLRFYNQNRIKVWGIVLAIIFIIMLIQVLNDIAKQEVKNNSIGEEETASNVVSYRNESKTIIEGGSISKQYREEFGNIIDKFYTFCINHEPDKAYELLAPDTKEELYPTKEQFEKLYYEEKFEGNKQYSFQSWTKSSEDIYIYQIKIFNNMLETGESNDEYIEDFVTIVPEEDTFKLNINKFIEKELINKKQNSDIITVEVPVVDIYLDYKIYTFEIKNNTKDTLLLDTRRKNKTIYLKDEKGNKKEAFIHELAKKDLTLKPNESKKLKIKFNDVYSNQNDIMSINFTDIVKQEELQKNQEIEANSLKIEL